MEKEYLKNRRGEMNGGKGMNPALILKKRGLKRTLGRVRVLEILIESDCPITGGDIARLLGTDSMDPASVYRILNAFVSHDVAHRLVGVDDVARYALNRGGERHPHFTCRVCGAVTCLTDVRLPRVEVPDDRYIVEEEHLTLRGICPDCSGSVV